MPPRTYPGRDGLQAIQKARRWCRRRSGVRPAYVRNLLEGDFTATAPNRKRVRNITCTCSAWGWPNDLRGGAVVGWSMSTTQDRQLALRAMPMACWQCPRRRAMILHSDRGAQFTSYEYQQFLKDHHITSSMSEVGHRGSSAPAEGFFDLPKRGRFNRRRLLTADDAWSDMFDYTSRFHSPRIQRQRDSGVSALTQPSTKTA